jgi:hypothetical protein
MLHEYKWFNLDNYARTDELDYEGWSKQLRSRIFLQTLLNANSLHEFDRDFANIQVCPFFDLDHDINYAAARSVYPITYGAACNLVEQLSNVIPAPFTNCVAEIERTGGTPPPMHAYFTVDLNASETQIINHFKALLAPTLARNRQLYPRPREAEITPAVLKSWDEHRILPCIDLDLWRQRNSLPEFSGTELGAFIFSDDSRINSPIEKHKARKAMIKAEEALRLTTIRQLSFAA